ncbi:hypothetical protein HDU87_003307 [Geranomyces variabilis]|uniref:K Homology domain-containing protein n=1 Tax=Geranomyces variabilis TaxID=109894 RepID=A0AAD5XMM2_9FUNG|nr:hypothetical protein HDU87_003307 [Geranomyces variabilis]
MPQHGMLSAKDHPPSEQASTEQPNPTQKKKRKWDITADDGHDQEQEGAPRKEVKLKPEDSVSPAVQSSESTEDAARAAMERATAAALKLNAQLGTPASQSASAGPDGLSSSGASRAPGPVEEFFEDVPINDIKNRYLLTKGATQSMIKHDTGADVTTRGKYYPDKNLATPAEPPLYLHVSASTQKSLDDALKAINELINSAPPQFEERRHSGVDRPPPMARPVLSERVYVGIEPDRNFNVRPKIVGPQGQYVKHIQQETQTKVQLKGRGSGFIEHDTGMEANDALHIHVTGFSEQGVEAAKKLCEDLIDTVKLDYQRTLEQRRARPAPYHGPPQHHGYGSPGGWGGHGSGGYGGWEQQPAQQFQQHQQPPPPAAAGYAADPYAAWGGYEAYAHYYYSYGYAPPAVAAQPIPGSEQAPPPPPTESAAPPPPPPSSSSPPPPPPPALANNYPSGAPPPPPSS